MLGKRNGRGKSQGQGAVNRNPQTCQGNGQGSGLCLGIGKAEYRTSRSK